MHMHRYLYTHKKFLRSVTISNHTHTPLVYDYITSHTHMHIHTCVHTHTPLDCNYITSYTHAHMHIHVSVHTHTHTPVFNRSLKTKIPGPANTKQEEQELRAEPRWGRPALQDRK